MREKIKVLIGKSESEERSQDYDECEEKWTIFISRLKEIETLCVKGTFSEALIENFIDKANHDFYMIKDECEEYENKMACLKGTYDLLVNQLQGKPDIKKKRKEEAKLIKGKKSKDINIMKRDITQMKKILEYDERQIVNAFDCFYREVEDRIHNEK